MKHFLLILLISGSLKVTAQVPPTPDQLYGNLFVEVLMKQIFPDNKTFVDCTPKLDPKEIMSDYGMLKGQDFNLKMFIEDNFDLPEPLPQRDNLQHEKDVTKHIKSLWSVLAHMPDSARRGSSLLRLPYPYIVPGGRFREMYYWDSYFTMLGLKESGEITLIENMLDNFAWLINTYGHIPNGTRSYYLSRSQPPFFSLMIELLASLEGDSVYLKYLPSLEKEYSFFMEGSGELNAGESHRRVVKMVDGSLLNRYWDDIPKPRPEGFRQDVLIADTMVMLKLAKAKFSTKEAMDSARTKYYEEAFTHIRAAAESGIDFSTRWFGDGENFTTIETTDIIPPDLNCLIYNMEQTLAHAYEICGDISKQAFYSGSAAARKNAINKYCYDPGTGYYYDYNFVLEKQKTTITPAGMYPFCFFPPAEMFTKAVEAASLVKTNLLKDGGIVTTSNFSGQQWDFPNGWAPLNWMTIWGFDRCEQKDLAIDIAKRWVHLNTSVYERTGKLLEKYNVIDIHLESGGGEYPTQDGFGWTNGVLLALLKKYDIQL